MKVVTFSPVEDAILMPMLLIGESQQRLHMSLRIFDFDAT